MGALLRRLVGVAALAAVVVVPIAIAAPADTSRQGMSLSALEQRIFADVNAVRHDHGLVPLRLSASLTAAARQHSISMAAEGYFSHDSADGSSFSERLGHYYRHGPADSWSVGENLLWSSPSIGADAALEMWMKSPPHRENLLAPDWREIGISAVHLEEGPGVYDGLPVTIVTTDFGIRTAGEQNLKRRS